VRRLDSLVARVEQGARRFGTGKRRRGWSSRSQPPVSSRPHRDHTEQPAMRATKPIRPANREAWRASAGNARSYWVAPVTRPRIVCQSDTGTRNP
jgi:hypothetical protein